jgi:hypothetical protein
MLLRIKNLFINNKKLIILTFQIFWIIVFLLNKIANENLIEIPQFIYVNF